MHARSILLAAALALGAAAPASAADQVLYVGDSLGVGTTPLLKRELGADFSVRGDSRIGRPSGEGLRVLRDLVAPAHSIVVFDLGTNDDPAQPSVLAADLAAARRVAGDRCLVVATLNRPPLNGVPVDGLNDAVLSFAATDPAVQLVDWNAIVASEPSLLGDDRVHPTPEGYAVRAQLFAEAVASCAAPAAPLDETLSGRPRRRRKRSRRPRTPAPVPGIESSGISFTEAVEFRGLAGKLLFPSGDPPYPAVVLPGGTDAQAEYLSAHGFAALTYAQRARASGSARAADARAAAVLLRRSGDVDGSAVALWAEGDAVGAAAQAVAGDDRIAAIVAVSPSLLAPAELRDWRVRRRLGAGDAAVTHWLRLRARGDASLRETGAAAWSRVEQPVLAVWGTQDDRVPVRASAARLRDALAEGPGLDHSFRWFEAGHALTVGGPEDADDPEFLRTTTRWLAQRLGDDPPDQQTGTPLPPANPGPQPIDVADSSVVWSLPVQAGWLALAALLLALGRRGGEADAPVALAPAARRLVAVAVLLALATAGAIAAGIAVALAGDGRNVAQIAGVPLLFALAFALIAAGIVVAGALARRRAWLALAGSGAWIALALVWLL